MIGIFERNFLLPTVTLIGFAISVFIVNPRLFSSTELKSKFTQASTQNEFVVPDPKSSVNDSLETGAISALGPGSTPDLDAQFITDKRYVLQNPDLVRSPMDVSSEAPDYVFTSNGIYFLSKDKKRISKVGLDSKINWTFDLQNEPFQPKILLSRSLVFLANNAKQVLALEHGRPKVRWIAAFPAQLELLSLTETSIVTIEKEKDKFRFVSLNQKTGEIEKESDSFNGALSRYGILKDGTIFSSLESGDVQFFDPSELKETFKTSLGSPLSTDPIVADKRALFTTNSGLLLSWDLTANTKIYETTLAAPARGVVAVIPAHNRICLSNGTGQLHCLNRSTGESEWRFNTNTAFANPVVFPARWPLTGQGEEIARLAKYGGWVVWTPCNDDRYCVFDPQNGQLLARHFLPGKVASAPMFSDEQFLIAARDVKDPKGGANIPWTLVEFKAIRPKKPTTETGK